MGTPTPLNPSRSRLTKAGAIRGVEAEAPNGWSVPEPAERIASFARSMGWAIQSAWSATPDGLVLLKVEIGRMLYPGENSKAKGDRWLYRLIWVEARGEERPTARFSRMRLAVNRCLTPSAGVWKDGPSMKLISDVIGRNPKPGPKPSLVPSVKIKADPAKLG